MSNSTVADRKPGAVTKIHPDGSSETTGGTPPKPADEKDAAMRIAVDREFKDAIDKYCKDHDISLASLLRKSVAAAIGYTLPPESETGHRTRVTGKFVGMTPEQKAMEQRVGWRTDSAMATAEPKMVRELLKSGAQLTTELLDAKAAELRKELETKIRAKMAAEAKYAKKDS